MKKYLLLRRRNQYSEEFIILEKETYIYEFDDLIMNDSDDREALEEEAKELAGLSWYLDNKHLY